MTCLKRRNDENSISRIVPGGLCAGGKCGREHDELLYSCGRKNREKYDYRTGRVGMVTGKVGVDKGIVT